MVLQDSQTPQSLQTLPEVVLLRQIFEQHSLETVLEKFLTFLDDHYPVGHNQKLDELIQRLILHLQTHRCLLILDNFESLLQSKALTGEFC
jgi:hypothetical protein